MRFVSEDAPHVGSLVYYFPEEGFLEQCASVPSGIDPDLPLFLCSVESVCLLADPNSDEVYSVTSLNPITSSSCHFNDYYSSTSPPQTHPALFSSKVLSRSDTTTGSFTHIYRGSPKRNWLTTGWSKFVRDKNLTVGDTIVFIRDENDLFLGVQREKHYVRSRVAAEELLDAVMAAAEGRRFQVRSRDAPRLSVVAKEIVERHVLTESGSANVRIKMTDKVRTLVLQNATPGSLIKILGECIEEEKAEIPEVRE
ncbi:Auxin response factor 11 [Carex littledalei]|uniref:Auxin response factor 11 n=1 Tax=Carex littledalei TaxID=544730 RepID=A0A833RCR2_9POAL|nr:Auxin response factor 11 [Carex littledalei]